MALAANVESADDSCGDPVRTVRSIRLRAGISLACIKTVSPDGDIAPGKEEGAEKALSVGVGA